MGLASATCEWESPDAVDARRIYRLHNRIQSYAWGSSEAIPALLGTSQSSTPWAELWMGAHPSAPSRLLTPAGWIALDAWIARDPEGVLGPVVARRFDGRMPFLFKILAAAAPLSIQAHPSLDQARTGFDRENAAGIPLDAPNRCYRDANHKPELICALTPFTALNRFRAPAEIVERLEVLEAPDLRGLLQALSAQPNRDGLRTFFTALMSLPGAVRDRILARAGERARNLSESPWVWVQRLLRAYPADIWALAPLLLNLVELAPGQAIYLPAGELHSYLGGLAVELMANSDNVLRGGLTRKHVDVEELGRTLTFRSGPVELLEPSPLGGNGPERLGYATPAEEFELSVLQPSPGRPVEAVPSRGIEILLCVEGEVRVLERDSGTVITIPRGASALIPASVSRYRIEGRGCVHRASAAPA
jgi:mannose-6-phosphate isomerase